jgi:hypothetical protein
MRSSWVNILSWTYVWLCWVALYLRENICTIFGVRKKGRRVQYFVKWLGYQESFNSWIFKQDLQKRGVAVWSVSLANGTEHGRLWLSIPGVSIHFTTVNNYAIQLGKYPFLNVRLALLSRTLSSGENLHSFSNQGGVRYVYRQTKELNLSTEYFKSFSKNTTCTSLPLTTRRPTPESLKVLTEHPATGGQFHRLQRVSLEIVV